MAIITRNSLQQIQELLEGYDEILRSKAENAADMMADFIDASPSQAAMYAERYNKIRQERTRLNYSLIEVKVSIKLDEETELEVKS